MSLDPTLTLADLLDRYLAGELAPDQRIAFEKHLHDDPRLAAAVERLRVPLEDAGRGAVRAMSVDVEAAWLRQQSHVEGGRESTLATRATDNPSFGVRRDEQPWETRSLWRERGGTGMRGDVFTHAARWSSIAVGCAIAVAAAWFHVQHDDDASRTYTTGTGQRAMFVLRDGTRVTLAPRTTFRVVHFGRDARAVALEGEAYLQVANASDAPFTVRAGKTTTRVLGTAFSVRHFRSDENVRVAVESGRVSVRGDAARDAVTLVAGIVADVGDSVVTVRSDATVAGENGWLKDGIEFNDVPATRVLETLTRWYGYQFRYTDTALVQQKVTAWVSTQSSAQALSTLRRLLDVNLQVDGDTMTLVPLKSRVAPAHHATPYEIFTPNREVGR